jgi:hypothetical protein
MIDYLEYSEPQTQRQRRKKRSHLILRRSHVTHIHLRLRLRQISDFALRILRSVCPIADCDTPCNNILNICF